MTKIIKLAGDLKPVKTSLEEEEKPFLELVGEAIVDYEKNKVANDKRKPVGTKQPVVGSLESGIKYSGDQGFLSTIMCCYNNHYTLRTTPEDWWYTIIRTVALAVDKVSEEKKVRKFFVDHEGKKELCVYVGAPGCIPYGVNYEQFFSDMCGQIKDNIKVPDYVDTFSSDFSTSSSTHRIESAITTMSSVQSYFTYRMCCMCGIPEIHMLGTEEDWRKLKEKLNKLQTILKPIKKSLFLLIPWWGKVEIICDRLVDTYMGQPDVEWWSHIFNHVEQWGSGPPNEYNGWFITDLLNTRYVTELEDLPSGLTSVPVTLDHGNGRVEEAAFVTGILGMKLDKDAKESACSVQALHGWALFTENAE